MRKRDREGNEPVKNMLPSKLLLQPLELTHTEKFWESGTCSVRVPPPQMVRCAHRSAPLSPLMIAGGSGGFSLYINGRDREDSCH